MRGLIAVLLLGTALASAEPAPDAAAAGAEAAVDNLGEPLYTPFIERYMLDELRQLRSDLGRQRADLLEQITDREITAVNAAVSYATDTVTYFFYLIAGASTVMVLVGWNSLREIKDKVHGLAQEEVTRIVARYEERLQSIEQQLQQKTDHINANREEIERTQEIHSLWLRASQESLPAGKVAIYDSILALRPGDCEALTYKADAALELDEPQWAINLCQKALKLDADNAHAFYQLACAHAALGHRDEACQFLAQALAHNEAYREEAAADEAFASMAEHPGFQELVNAAAEMPRAAREA